MRMWLLNPKKMCNKHLLGEHGEIHKFRHSFVKKHNMNGRLKYPAQIDPILMGYRHDQLAKEMLRRGMNHKSPYIQPGVSHLPVAYVDLTHNTKDLSERCPDCRKLLKGEKNV